MWAWAILAVLCAIGFVFWLRARREEKRVLRDMRTCVDAMIEGKLQRSRAEFADQLRRVDEKHGIRESVN